MGATRTSVKRCVWLLGLCRGAVSDRSCIPERLSVGGRSKRCAVSRGRRVRATTRGLAYREAMQAFTQKRTPDFTAID